MSSNQRGKRLSFEPLEDRRVLAAPVAIDDHYSVLSGQALVAGEPEAVYWSHFSPASSRGLWRANIDGTDSAVLIPKSVTGEVVTSVAVDPIRRKLYWTSYEVSPGPSKVFRANLDGSEPEMLLSGIGDGSLRSLQIDLAEQKLYWVNRSAPSIQRVNLDGSGLETVISDGLDQGTSIAIDVYRGYIYWHGHGTGVLGRARLDGSEVVSLPADLLIGTIDAFAFDPTQEVFYLPSEDGMIRATLDGTVREQIPTARAATIDAYHRHLYFNKNVIAGIRRVNLDGSDETPLVAIPGITNVPSIALYAPTTPLTANDRHESLQPLVASIVDPPSHGVLVLNVDGHFAYRSHSGYVGADSFTYRVNDGFTDSNVATVAIYVQPASGMANDDGYFVGEDTALHVDAAAGLLANDFDNGTSRVASLLSGPNNGLLTLNPDGSFNYQPAENFSGKVAFTYQLTAAFGTTQATAMISVLPSPDPPIVADSSFEVGVNQSVVALQRVPQQDPLDTWRWWKESSGGNGHVYVQVGSQGTLTWEQAKEAAESMSFYGIPGHLATIRSQAESVAVNAVAGWIGGYQDTAAPDYLEPFGGWRWITGEPWDYTHWGGSQPNNLNGNQHLLAIDPAGAGGSWGDYASTDTQVNYIVEFSHAFHEPLMPSASDADFDLLTAALVDGPSHGTLTFNPDFTFVYVPNLGFEGVDSFRYRVSDGQHFSNIANVTITVGSLPDVLGDFNGDRRVDLLDLAELQTRLGTLSGATALTGDLTGDGMVNRADVAEFARRFGANAMSGESMAASAPEAIVQQGSTTPRLTASRRITRPNLVDTAIDSKEILSPLSALRQSRVQRTVQSSRR